jgi:hypothetical protein
MINLELPSKYISENKRYYINLDLAFNCELDKWENPNTSKLYFAINYNGHNILLNHNSLRKAEKEIIYIFKAHVIGILYGLGIKDKVKLNEKQYSKEIIGEPYNGIF